MAYTYILNKSNTKSHSQLMTAIQNNLKSISEVKEHGICSYFDTFDWRLFHQGLYLYHFNQYLYLYQYTKHRVEYKQRHLKASMKNYALEEGDLLKKIGPILNSRSLINRATFRINKQSFRILNRYDKIIARIVVEQSEIKDNSMLFSYELHEGICTDFNASELMERVGIKLVSDISKN